MGGLLVVMAFKFNVAFGDDMSSEFNLPRQGARFARGTTTLNNTFLVSPTGGVFEVKGPDKTIERISVKVPPNAVSKETQISIGFNNGTFLPVRGKASGYVIVIDAQGVQAFQQAVEVSVLNSQSIQEGVPVGFSIEDDNKIKLIDSVYDKGSGNISFFSFRPMMFTWVYTKA